MHSRRFAFPTNENNKQDVGNEKKYEKYGDILENIFLQNCMLFFHTRINQIEIGI